MRKGDEVHTVFQASFWCLFSLLANEQGVNTTYLLFLAEL